MTDLIKVYGTAKQNGYTVTDEFGADISSRVAVFRTHTGELAVVDEFNIYITKRVSVK